MRGKKRPAAERAHAVGVALLDGASEASRRTGIPETTINGWMHSQEFVELRERTKEAVADEWWAGVQHGFRRVIEAFDQEADVQKKATAAAILFDKVAMLRGEATSRSEARDITNQFNDHENDTLSELLRAELARRSDENAAASAVEVAEQAGATTPD